MRRKPTNGFDKNPQNINRKGRPKTLLTITNERLLEESYDKLSKAEFLEFIKRIFNATEEECRDFATNKEVPFTLRIIVSDLLSTEKRYETIIELRDYAFGKTDKNNKNRLKARVLTAKELGNN